MGVWGGEEGRAQEGSSRRDATVALEGDLASARAKDGRGRVVWAGKKVIGARRCGNYGGGGVWLGANRVLCMQG